MAAPKQSICGTWATEVDLCAPCSDYGVSIDPDVMQWALQMSSDILYELSGRRWSGCCSDTVRPNARYANYPERVLGWVTGMPAGYGWLNGRLWNGLCTCNRENRTGCNYVSEITLGGYPLVEILEVKVDGVLLDPSQYRIDDYKWLVRLPNPDGTREGWPCCQDMLLDDDQPGTFSVKYVYGINPPIGGVRAAASLACQLALACQEENAEMCKLPERTIQVARQGVTMIVIDPMEFVDKGRTGLYDVDLWLGAVNPANLRGRATVVTPEMMPRVRRANR